MENKIKIMKYCDLDIVDSNLDDFYLVVFKDLFESYKVYFANIECDHNFYIAGNNGNIILLVKSDNENEQYYSYYGEIDSIVRIRDLILTYGIINSEYKVETVNAIIEAFINDYIELKKSDTIKKLELKRK